MKRDYTQKFNERLELFLDAIKKYKDQELAVINQKATDQQEYERNRIQTEARDKNESYFHKKEKAIEMDSKIARSRKINECRMSKMRLRHEFIERIQQQVRTTLIERMSNETVYRELLKKLMVQGLIKMLQENVEVKCLKKDVALVKQVARQSEAEFNKMSSVQSQITVNERQNLADSDIGGIYITSLKGRIVCNNTLAARVDYCVQALLPDIRHVLFKPSAQEAK